MAFPEFRYGHAEVVMNRERIGSLRTTLLSELDESILSLSLSLKKAAIWYYSKMLHLHLLQDYAVLNLRDYLIIRS